MRKFLFLLVILAGVVGCASFTKSTGSELLVQYATIKFINASEDPQARAAQVVAVASTGIDFFDNDTLPLEEIESLIRSKIEWSKLDAADTMLANALILRVRDEVESSAHLPEEERVSGSKVLTWIVTAARMLGG